MLHQSSGPRCWPPSAPCYALSPAASSRRLPSADESVPLLVASSPPLPSADEFVPLLVASSRRLPSEDELLRVASCHQLPFASDSFQLLDDSFHHQLRLLLKKKKIEAYHMCHRSEQ